MIQFQKRITTFIKTMFQKTKTNIKLRSEGKKAKIKPYGGIILGLMDF